MRGGFASKQAQYQLVSPGRSIITYAVCVSSIPVSVGALSTSQH